MEAVGEGQMSNYTRGDKREGKKRREEKKILYLVGEKLWVEWENRGNGFSMVNTILLSFQIRRC